MGNGQGRGSQHMRDAGDARICTGEKRGPSLPFGAARSLALPVPLRPLASFLDGPWLGSLGSLGTAQEVPFPSHPSTRSRKGRAMQP